MSNPLDGFEVMDAPKNLRRSWSYMGEAVEAFAESGNECMGKRFESSEEAHKAYMSAKHYIKYHQFQNVKASIRRDTVLLLRA